MVKEKTKKDKPETKKAIAAKPRKGVVKAAVSKHKPEKKIAKAKATVKSIKAKPEKIKTALKREVTVKKEPPVKVSPAVAQVAVSKAAESPRLQEIKTPESKPPVASSIAKPVQEARPQVNGSTPLIINPELGRRVKHEPAVTKKEVVQPSVAPVAVDDGLKELEVEMPVTVKDLAIKLQQKPSVLIKDLMAMKIMAGINQSLEEKTASQICLKFGYRIKNAPGAEEQALKVHEEKDLPDALVPRFPIVTFMGHVDHGKTSLLDAIRKTKVAEREHGGITQHIGAYRVILKEGEITFLDTPGHEAFTAMRARGASVTDIVVLVVAADDGVMPQTKEAIDHARAADVPIVVAMNKMDKPQANPDRLKKQLSELGLTAEDWGGKTIVAPVSAKTGEGIDTLLEMILLEAQMLELKANPKKIAKGVVIEAKLSKGRGPVVTLLVQNGTLHLNENIIVGDHYGKIRAMFNDRLQAITQAGPSMPVEVLGISGVPEAGEPFFVIEDEKKAKELALLRQEKLRQQQIKTARKISLDELHAQIAEGKLKELKLILKADVQGSLEAIKETLNKLNVTEIKLNVIHDDVGNVNSSDVVLAVASNALILGFSVDADERAKELISKEGIDFRTYNIIYELGNDIKAAIEGMLAPRIKKIFMGRADIRKVFNLSRSGTIAGCFVTKGKFTRTATIELLRNGEKVFEGKLSSLKRFKDDVREVGEGFECGMALAGFNDYKEGDTLEAFELEKIARKIE